jgi:uncharacterized membrane protein HdeD (DUF308 family)
MAEPRLEEQVGVATRLEAPRTWWSFALRGVLAIVAGMLLVVHPIPSVMIMSLALGAWIFVDGVVALVSAWTQDDRRWTTAPIGAIGIVMGYLLLTRTGTTSILLFVLIAVWALARGAAEVGVAARMRTGEPGRRSLAFLGIVSVLFGMLIIAAPFSGLVLVVSWIGVYAFIYGAIDLVRAVEVHRDTSRPSIPHAA